MNKQDVDKFINKELINKSEILSFLNSHVAQLEHKKEKISIIKLYNSFISRIENTHLKTENRLFYYYLINQMSDGLKLDLYSCNGIEYHDNNKTIFEPKYIETIIYQKCAYVDVNEFSQINNVAVTTVRQWIRRGKIRNAVKNGRDWLIPEIGFDNNRGYVPVTYHIDPESIIYKQYSFLNNCNTVSIEQDSDNKNLYNCLLFNHNRIDNMETMTMTMYEREAFELALISDNYVFVDEEDNYLPVNIDNNKYKYYNGKIISSYDSYDNQNEFKENSYSIKTRVDYNSYDGLYVHDFDIYLHKESYNVASIICGMIIPNYWEFDYDTFTDPIEFADSIDGDMLFVAEDIWDQDEGTIKDDVINSLDLDETYKLDSSVLYFSEIKYKNKNHLRILFKYFYLVKSCLPSLDTHIAVTIQSKERDKEIIEMLELFEWLIIDHDSCIVAYKKI